MINILTPEHLFQYLKKFEASLDSAIVKGDKKITFDLIKKIDNLEEKIPSYLTSQYKYKLGEYHYTVGLHFRLKSEMKISSSILSKLKPENYKEELRVQLKFMLARSLFCEVRFTKEEKIAKNKSALWNQTSLDKALEAKKIYTQLLIKEISEQQKNTSILEVVVHDLTQLLCDLYRWTEAYYYINSFSKENAFNSALKIIILDMLSQYTCSDDYQLSSLYSFIIKTGETIDHTRFSSESDLQQVSEIIEKAKNGLKKHKLKLREEKTEHTHLYQLSKNHNNFRSFILKNSLALSEHSIYCGCDLSKHDKLTITNDHVRKHHELNIHFFDSFQRILDAIVIDFHHARISWYKGLNKDNSSSYPSSLKLENKKEALNHYELLKAFKLCYTILDKIALGLISAIAPNQLKTKNDVYFWKCFEQGHPIQKQLFKGQNEYLLTLYSISKDLELQGVFSEFREWRNKIEHSIVILEENVLSSADNEYLYKINKREFIEKTELLFQLTRSAIFSYCYFLRRSSKNSYNG